MVRICTTSGAALSGLATFLLTSAALAGGNPACTPDAGPCGEANGTPGCDDIECCNEVCLSDPFCCDTEWDDICAEQALVLCGDAGANDACADREPIAEGDTAFSTIGADTDGVPHATCQFDGQTYQDIWYNFTAPMDGFVTVSTCNQADYDTDLVAYDGCDTALCPPGDDLLLACNDDEPGCAGFSSLMSFDVIAGNCYKIRVGGWNPGDEGTGTVTIAYSEPPGEVCGEGAGSCFEANGTPGCEDVECCEAVCGSDPFCCDVEWDQICADAAAVACGDPCEVPCDGGTDEAEPCGSDTNGGCNSTPAVFGAIAVGETICGNGWADGGTRDTDWFLFDVTEECKEVTATLTSAFSGVVFIVGGIDTCTPVVIGATGSSTLCEAGPPATATLTPGTYAVFVAPSVFEGFPCDSGFNSYTVTLDSAACEFCDLTCPDGASDEGEVCGEDTNGGCNSTPIVFGAISCGETICGTGWADGGTRDTDWYLVTTTDECTRLTADLVSEFDAVTFIVDGIDGCAPVVIGQTGASNECVAIAPAVADVGPGTYAIFVAPAAFEGAPCGTQNDYQVTLTCTECVIDPPPANDLCADRIEIGDGDTDYSTISAETDGLPHVDICQFDGQVYEDIWYNYTATCDGTLTISTCNQAAYDTDLAVYSSCDTADCPPGDELLLGCNDDADGCAGFTSEVTIDVQCGQCYKIRVGGWNPGDEGTGTLTITCDGTPCGAECEWNLDGEGAVGAGDLAILLANWNNPYGPADLAALLAEWGCE